MSYDNKKNFLRLLLPFGDYQKRIEVFGSSAKQYYEGGNTVLIISKCYRYEDLPLNEKLKFFEFKNEECFFVEGTYYFKVGDLFPELQEMIGGYLCHQKK